MSSITSEVPGEPDLSGRHNDPLGTLTLAPDLRIISRMGTVNDTE